MTCLREAVEEDDCVACVSESDFQGFGGIVENSENADDGRGKNGFAEGFVVEADVAAGNGRTEGGAGFADAVDGLGKLPHDFGLFGRSEEHTSELQSHVN